MDFNYEKAGSLGEALTLKSRYRERGAFIAGGTDLMVDMRNGVLEPEPHVIIDISGLDELAYIRSENGRIHIGAVSRISELEKSPIVQSGAPILASACRKCANPLIRNSATLGGNLVNASPAADMATPLLALGARAVLKSTNGTRAVPLEEFFTGVKTTSHRDDELLTEVIFDEAPGKSGEFLKLGQRNGTFITIVSMAITFTMEGGIIGDDVRLTLGSVAPVPMRAYQAEAALRGAEPSPENIRHAGEILKDEVNPITDVRGSAGYRREMSAALLQMAFQNLGYGLDKAGEKQV